MNMRELVTERILFAFDSDDLMAYFHITESELENLTDCDLLEIYEESIDMMLGLSGISGAPWSAGKPPNEMRE